MSPVSKAHMQASRRYNEKAYDRLEITVKKGGKEELQVHAAERGESLNGFVNRAIYETVERDKGGQDTGSEDTPAQEGGA